MTNLDQLHLINTLFARVTGNDLYLAEQIKSAITASLSEAENRAEVEPAFTSAAAELMGKLFEGVSEHGFHHWDAAASPESPTPLFTRAGVLTGLKRLAPYKEATLLVSNLRAAHAPAGRRWTPQRQREYDEALMFIRELTAKRSRESANINLLFL
ncbi:MAG TPA: hypothetical protein VKC60_10585 [Opitutaceae bacterium]|nr:hypothetical protein [Opitutaceae bacterium]